MDSLKWFLIIIVLIVASLIIPFFFVSAPSKQTESAKQNRFTIEKQSEGGSPFVYLITDTATGSQYISISGSNTPVELRKVPSEK